MLTEERLDVIDTRLVQYLQKIPQTPSQETTISKLSAQTATKLLTLNPHQMTAVHGLPPCDMTNWLLHCALGRETDPYMFLFPEEVNSQSRQYWSSHNLRLMRKFHYIKTGLWRVI
jgi:hypothetical protein